MNGEREMVYNRLFTEVICGEMGSWRSWFSFKNSLLHHSRGMPFKFTSFLKHKTKENRAGLMSLYKDMEAFEGYADIQVMWEMVHSSSLPIERSRELRTGYFAAGKFKCFVSVNYLLLSCDCCLLRPSR